MSVSRQLLGGIALCMQPGTAMRATDLRRDLSLQENSEAFIDFSSTARVLLRIPRTMEKIIEKTAGST